MVSPIGVDRVPLSLYFNITDYCNSRCIFCAAGIPDLKNPAEIPSESILQIYERYDLRPGDDIVINGGEPTLYRDLEIVVREAAIRGVTVTLFTNGRLLCDLSKARAWLEAGVDRVSIPLHGSRADTHDMLTKRSGSFDQTIIGIRNAFALQDEIGFPKEIELKVLAVRNSLEEWPQIIELIAKEFGAPDILVISGLNMWSSATHLYKTLSPTIEQVYQFLNVALQCAASHRMPVSLWAIPLCLLTDKNLKRFVVQREQSRTVSRKRVIYFDPLYLDGVEYPDEEFTPYREVEPICQECHLAQICGPGRVFFQQLLTVST